ncbi:MAG TPA: ABC transporter permease, partial [Candidatus Acidoferrum sp.]
MRPKHWLYTVPLRMRSLFRSALADQELDEELHDHLEQKTEQYVAKGMAPKEARRMALVELGGVEQTKEKCRDARRIRWLQDLAQDFRYGLRMLRKSPGFTAVALFTLTLGIGVTSSIFSVVDAVLLRHLPYRNPDRLVSLYEDRSSTGFPLRQFTPANFADCKAQTGIFEDLAAIDADRFYNLTSIAGNPEKLSAEGVTHNLFSILGVQPMIGRVFLPEEDTAGSEHVVLLSHRLWSSRFGGDPKIVGQNILLNAEEYSVVGVMPQWFSFPDKNADLWVPTAFTSQQLADRGAHFLTVIGILHPGVSVRQANAELRVLSQNLRQQHMDIMRFVDRFIAVPLQEVYTADVRGGLIVLLAAVGFILLIACANIANLLLSRATLRQREIALRSALGARRTRIIRQLLTESLVLATTGGFLGIVLTEVSFRFLKALIPEDLSRTVSLTLNLPILWFAILISLASTFLFGLMPALRMSKANLTDSLKEGGRGSASGRSKSIGNLLVVGEIALSLVLLVAAGLLLKTFVNLREQDPGFRSEQVLTAQIDVPDNKYPNFVRRTQFFQAVLERVRAMPTVSNAGFTSVLPFSWKSGMGGFLGMAGFQPEGYVQSDIQYGALDRVVSPGYFETMGIRLLRGRLFDSSDGPDAPSVAIVNETMARKFWPNEDVLGKRLRFTLVDGGFRLYQIIGIVNDVKELSLDEPPKEEMYFPYWQAQGNYMVPSTLVVRTTGDLTSLASATRHAVWSVDADQPVSEIITMEGVLDRDVAQKRVQGVLLGAFAALALTLACVGIYGVMAYLVTQQSHEIGIRLALGANSRDVLGLIMGRGAKLTGMGMAIGIAAAILVTRLMRGLLFGISAVDPLTFASMALLLSTVALAACYIPARRAMRVDPMVALR